MGSHGEPAKESKRYLKLSIYFRKNPELTDEEFHRYWSEEHPSIFTSVPIIQEKVVKYNQYHNSIEDRKKAASLGLPIMEFDGAAEIWTEDMESMLSWLQDPEYLKTVVPDEEKFASRQSGQFMFGWDELKMDRTEAIRTNGDGYIRSRAEKLGGHEQTSRQQIQ